MLYIINNLKYLIISFVVIGIWLIILEVICHKKGIRTLGIAFVVRWIFGIYVTMVFALTVSPVYGWSFPHFRGTINLKPFEVFRLLPDGKLNFIGNILMFVPMGFLLRSLTGRRSKPSQIFVGTTVSCVIEGLQLFTNRGTDVDDIILNTLGTAIGWMIASVVYVAVFFTENEDKKQRRYPLRVSRVSSILFLSLTIVMVVGFKERKAVIKPNTYENIQDATLSTVKPKAVKLCSTPSGAEELHVSQSNQDKNDSIVASSGILVCTDSNEIMWEKNSTKEVAPASCAKLLTALTALKYCDADETLTVGNEVKRISKDASRAYLSVGAELTVHQAMIAMLLPSGNDAAYALAVFTGRKIACDPSLSIDEALLLFQSEMNAMAKEIGANHSKFISPDGYDVDGQYTTAYDLAVIGTVAANNELIAMIVRMDHSREVWISGETAEYYNTNEMLQKESAYYLPECTGLKTGTSTRAGACLVMSFTVSGKNYMGVVMGSTKESRFDDAIQIFKMIQ